MAEATVDVPKVGAVKRQYLYAVGVGVAGYVGWRYWTAAKAAKAAAAAAPPESAGTFGADIGSGTGGYNDPNGSGIGGSTTVGHVLATDQDWYAAAMLALQDAGYDTGAAAVALGKYLRTEPLTAAEQDMVKVALAAAGNPPSGAKAIVTGNPPAPSGLTAPQHLRGNGTPTTSSIPLAWDAVSGASGYIVYRGGDQIATVTGTSYTVGGLHPGTAYTHTVRAKNTGGTLSAPSAGYTAITAFPAPTGAGGSNGHPTPTPHPKGPSASSGTAIQTGPRQAAETAIPTQRNGA